MGFPILTLQSLMMYDDTLFDDIQLPDGADQETLVDTICMEYGQMQLLYPDWATMRRAAKSWFNRKAVTLAHLWQDYQASYNPLYNKDAYYDEVRTPDLKEVRTPDLTIERSPDLTTELTHGHVATESGQRESQLQGFNSASYANVSRDLPAGVLTNSGKDTTTEAGSDTTTQTGTDTTTHTGTETINRREYGNIGVTTSTQMLRDDVSFWREFSWYDIVAKEFAVDFCVMIY